MPSGVAPGGLRSRNRRKRSLRRMTMTNMTAMSTSTPWTCRLSTTPASPPPSPRSSPMTRTAIPTTGTTSGRRRSAGTNPPTSTMTVGGGVQPGSAVWLGWVGSQGKPQLCFAAAARHAARETGLGWTCSTRTPTMGFHAACSCLHNEPALPKRPRPRPCRPPAEHGRLYYSNPDTRVSSWDKPDSLEWEEHLDGDSVPCVGAACFPGVGPHLGRGVGRVNCAACQQM